MDNLRTTNRLLLILVIPLVFYLLKTLSFIFVPLVLAMFISLLFLPLMRWFDKKKVHKAVSVLLVVLIITGIIKVGSELIRLSSKEILSVDNEFFEKAKAKLLILIVSIENFFGISRPGGENILSHYFQKFNISQSIAPTLDFVVNTLSKTLMTAFFIILLLSGSLNFQKLLSDTMYMQKYSSIKVFMKIERDVVKFIWVKFLISLFTGIGFSLACLFFDISFPVFWGLFAFLVNFIQMVGSIIAVIVLSLFAFVELDPTGGTFLFFVLTLIAVQVLFGSILEPVFMGKSFSINIITILVMLMLWGYIWGIPGLIMSVPLTVLTKIVLEQFPKTKMVAGLFSGAEKKIIIAKYISKKK